MSSQRSDAGKHAFPSSDLLLRQYRAGESRIALSSGRDVPDSDRVFPLLVTIAAPLQFVVLCAFPSWLRAPLDARTIDTSKVGGLITEYLREKLGPKCSTLELYAWAFFTTPDRIWKVIQWSGLVMSLEFGIAGIVLLSTGS